MQRQRPMLRTNNHIYSFFKKVCCVLMLASFSSASPAITVSMIYTDPVIRDGIIYQTLVMSSISNIDAKYDRQYNGACPTRLRCWIGIAMTNDIGAIIPGDGATKYMAKLRIEGNLSGQPSLGEILRATRDLYLPFGATVSKPVATSYGKVCVGLVIQPDEASQVATIIDFPFYSCSDGSGGGIIPTPPVLPPEKVTCSIIPSVTLNHQTLNIENVHNNKATEVVNINCDGKATVSLSFSPKTIDLSSDGKLKSNLLINDKSGTENIIINKNGYVNLSSVLQADPTFNSGGDFSGSSVLTMSFQ